MACSPMPKVGGAAAPSAPPVPTPMVILFKSFWAVLKKNQITQRVSVVDKAHQEFTLPLVLWRCDSKSKSESLFSKGVYKATEINC